MATPTKENTTDKEQPTLSLSSEEKKQVDGVLADVYQEFNNSFNSLGSGGGNNNKLMMKGFGSEDINSNGTAKYNNASNHDSFKDSHGLPVGVGSHGGDGKASELTEEQIQELFVKRLREKKQVQQELQESNSLKNRAGSIVRSLYRTISGGSNASQNTRDYKSKYGNLEKQKQHQLDIIKQSLGPELEGCIEINNPTLTKTSTSSSSSLPSQTTSPSSVSSPTASNTTNTDNTLQQSTPISPTLKRINLLKKLGAQEGIVDGILNPKTNNTNGDDNGNNDTVVAVPINTDGDII